MKYANPNEIKVAVNSVKDCIEISISDNGNGFDTEKTTLGNGLHNMKKRADEINSVITINSASANGTQISLKIPIKNT
jgi:signal transduction histidine kinase